jgi:subtilisin family serine protease
MTSVIAIINPAVAAVVVSSLAVIGSFSGMEVTSFAQPAPPVGKTIPPGIVRTKPEVVEGEVLVKYKEDLIRATDPSERAERIRRLGNVLQGKFPMTEITTHASLGIQRLKLAPGVSVNSAIERLRTFPEVEFAEPNYKIYPLYSQPPRDKYWLMGPPPLWGMKRIGMDLAWNSSATGISDNIIIAVLDTGIDYTHPDLTSQIWNNPGEYGKKQYVDDDGNGIIDDIHGVNYCWWTDPQYGSISPTGNPMDTSTGHGTAVAGVIGAVVDNPLQGDGGYVAGVHRKAKLMALKVLCADTDPEPSTVVNAAAAIDYAWMNGATVLNASWYVATGTAITSEITGKATGSQVLRDAIARARDHNALFVAAAGNSSAQKDNDSISIYPANYGKVGANDYLDNVIAVAATWDVCASGKSLDTNPSNPNYGKCDDGSTATEALWEQSHFGLQSVAIAAPGWLTYTTMPLSLEPLGITFPDGTSMASPHVAGCAALLQAKRATVSSVPPFSPKDLKDTLIKNADQAGIAGISNGLRLNCYQALTGDQAPPASPTGLKVQ